MSEGSSQQQSVQKIDDVDIGALVIQGAVSTVKNRPITFSFWILGLLMAAFANGFTVDETRTEAYKYQLDAANEVERTELSKALHNMQQAEQIHYNSKGWFWSCDDRCQKNHDKYLMAKNHFDTVQRKRDQMINDARHEVGIWSTFGVAEVRSRFWSSWEQGKAFAARCTMMDAFMLMMPGSREESAASMIIKLIFQYIANLTMGLIGAFFFFIYAVYNLVVNYGETMASGLAFFLLVLVAGMATVGTYLFAIYGTVAGGCVYLYKQAQKQAALEGERGGQRRQQINNQRYGGRPGGMGGGMGGGYGGRSHYD